MFLMFLNSFFCIFSFVVRMIQRQTVCHVCLDALEADMSRGLQNVYSLIAHKTNGGLIFACASVLKSCMMVEKQFTLLEQGTSYLTPQKDYLSKNVTVPVLTQLIDCAS